MAQVIINFSPAPTSKRISEGTTEWLVFGIQAATTTDVVQLTENDYLTFSVKTETNEEHTYSYTLTLGETIDLPPSSGTPIELGMIRVESNPKQLIFNSGYYRKA